MELRLLLTLSLILPASMSTFSLFSMENKAKAPCLTLLKICVNTIKNYKEILKPKIDDLPSKTLAMAICILHDKKELTDYESLTLAELCKAQDAVSPEIIEKIKESTQKKGIQGKIQLFETIPCLSLTTQRKIMGAGAATGTSVI